MYQELEIVTVIIFTMGFLLLGLKTPSPSTLSSRKDDMTGTTLAE